MKTVFVILFTFFSFFVKGQNVHYFRYDKVQSEADSANPSFFSRMVKRVYKTPNQFTEFGLFSADSTDGISFKKQNNIWYMYNGRTWLKFLSRNFKRNLILYKKTGQYNVIWKKSEDKCAFYFEITPTKGKSAHVRSYCFNLTSGIFITYSGNGMFKRFNVD